MRQRDVRRWIVCPLLLAWMASISDAADTKLKYELTVMMTGGELTLEHRLTNSSDASVCLFPDQVDVARARFFDEADKPIENIATSGAITTRQTVYIVYPDGLARAFVSSQSGGNVFRSPSDAARLKRVEYELFAYDCRKLVSKNYSEAKPVVHRTVTTVVRRSESK